MIADRKELEGLCAPEIEVSGRKNMALILRQCEKFKCNFIRLGEEASHYVRQDKFLEEAEKVALKESEVLVKRLRSAIESGEISREEEDNVLAFVQNLMVKAGLKKIRVREIWELARKT